VSHGFTSTRCGEGWPCDRSRRFQSRRSVLWIYLPRCGADLPGVAGRVGGSFDTQVAFGNSAAFLLLQSRKIGIIPALSESRLSNRKHGETSWLCHGGFTTGTRRVTGLGIHPRPSPRNITWSKRFDHGSLPASGAEVEVGSPQPTRQPANPIEAKPAPNQAVSKARNHGGGSLKHVVICAYLAVTEKPSVENDPRSAIGMSGLLRVEGREQLVG